MEARRYDIDWIRVIAIGLLLLYHVAIGFQPWGLMIGFITTERSWSALWAPMTMLNIWRIPLLFFVSGMGVYFALRRRTAGELLLERAKRILLPFLFGIVAIVPVHMVIWQRYYEIGVKYMPNPGHLWFLGNLFIYVLILLPLFCYLKRGSREREDGEPSGAKPGGAKRIARRAEALMRTPLGLLPVFALFIAEVLLVDPRPFELYAMTWHGFFLGLLAFFSGFFFVWCGDTFWNMLLRWRLLFLLSAIALFALRLSFFQAAAPAYLISIESNCWVFTVFAFGYRYLNRPGRALNYLSRAAYPVYIVHMIFLYLGSLFIFPLKISAPLQFGLLLLFTVAGCFVSYEFVIRRVWFLRPLFGLKKII